MKMAFLAKYIWFLCPLMLAYAAVAKAAPSKASFTCCQSEAKYEDKSSADAPNGPQGLGVSATTETTASSKTVRSPLIHFSASSYAIFLSRASGLDPPKTRC